MDLRVLVIDDDTISNLMADVLLRDLGISTQPHCFTNAQEALMYINQYNQPAITYLIFLDINMAIMTGWEMLERLQALPNHQNIHVVIVTSSIDSADKKRASGFKQVIDYKIKPQKRESLAGLTQHENILPCIYKDE